MSKMNEEDPIIMYLVVRENLHMSIGKTAAQVAHAAQRLQQKYQEVNDEINSYLGYDSGELDSVPENLRDKSHIFYQWLQTSVTKIVLKADEKEWAKLKEMPDIVRIADAGHTELAPGTETVVGFWPILKSQRPKVLKRLQVL